MMWAAGLAVRLEGHLVVVDRLVGAVVGLAGLVRAAV
jgi:hypothetical protein